MRSSDRSPHRFRLRTGGQRGCSTASLLAVTLAGCKTLDDPGAHVAGWTLVDPTQRHPIMVSQQPTTVNVRVARGSQGLTPAQRGQVAGFLERYRATDAGNSKLVIAVPSGSPNESRGGARGRRDAAADQRLRLLRGERRHRALPRAAATPARRSACPICATSPRRPSAATGPPTSPRTIATCPIPNFGCAQQRNLAAQIANPADLLGPRTMDPADPGAPRRGVRQVPPGQADGRREEARTSACRSRPQLTEV